jgi:hypothetical protein
MWQPDASARQLLVHHRFVAIDSHPVGVVHHNAAAILDGAAQLIVVAERTAHVVNQTINRERTVDQRMA